MFKPEKILGEPLKYVEEIGLNRVVDLATYLNSLKAVKSIKPPVEYFHTTKKSEFQDYLDKSFRSVIDSDKKIIKERSGDMDFILDKKRQDIYKTITSNGVKMQFLVDIDCWTLQNAELLNSVGAEVRRTKKEEDYHFGEWSESMMFTLSRTPARKEAEKIVGKPQKEEDVNYNFLATNQPDFVKFVNRLWEDMWKNSVSYSDISAELSKNKGNESNASQLLGS